MRSIVSKPPCETINVVSIRPSGYSTTDVLEKEFIYEYHFDYFRNFKHCL